MPSGLKETFAGIPFDPVDVRSPLTPFKISSGSFGKIISEEISKEVSTSSNPPPAIADVVIVADGRPLPLSSKLEESSS